MNKGQAPIQLSAFFQNRKPSLEQVIAFLQQFPQGQKKGTLAQRMGVLATVAKLLSTATKLWMEDINVFRIEICFNPLQETSKRTARRKSTIATGNKSTRVEQQTRRKQMTIDQILADAVQVSMSHNNSSIIATPRRDPLLPPNILPTPALPHTEAISMRHLDETSLSSPSFQMANATAEDKMITYQKLLAGEREELNVTAAPSLNSTRRKRGTSKRKVSWVRDEDIYLNEGPIKQQNIQKLSTKIKMAREFKGDPYDTFDNRWKEINPVLSKIQSLRGRLAQKLRERHVLTELNSTYIHQTEQFVQPSSLEQRFIINQSNNPIVTSALQSKLTHILEGALFIEPKVGFQDFCQKRRITREIKGELFYQLLHMDFPLEQPYPQIFGDIFIHPK